MKRVEDEHLSRKRCVQNYRCQNKARRLRPSCIASLEVRLTRFDFDLEPDVI